MSISFIHRVKYSSGQKFRRGKSFVGQKFRRGKFSPGKIFVGENFRHLTKISSLFPDEVFPDKVISLPDAIASWNLFMDKVVPSLDLLKNDIITLIRPESKSFFNVHDPTGFRYLFQLRFGLNPLKGHKYCHKFTDTPSGTCQCNKGIEYTSHFQLSCPFYTVQIVTLITSVIEILLKVNLIRLEGHSNLYLYGDPSINYSDNNKIILATRK